MQNNILVLYYSRYGSTKKLALQIARGVNSIPGIEAIIRTVPNVSAVCEQIEDTIPESGHPYVTIDELNNCNGLALGSPVRFGNMASSLKYFLDSTTDTWLKGNLVGKPACVFTSSTSMHGGQESCLLSMMIPLLHHGMLIMGLPYTDTELMKTVTGGTPYGVSHVDGINNNKDLSNSERHLAFIQGQNLAKTALKLI